MKIRFELQQAGEHYRAIVSGLPIQEHFGDNQTSGLKTYDAARDWLISAFINVAKYMPYTPSPLPGFLQDKECGFVEIDLNL